MAARQKKETTDSAAEEEGQAAAEAEAKAAAEAEAKAAAEAEQEEEPPEWQHPDYCGALDGAQAEWRNANLK